MRLLGSALRIQISIRADPGHQARHAKLPMAVTYQPSISHDGPSAGCQASAWGRAENTTPCPTHQRVSTTQMGIATPAGSV